ncbi:hypothetical protein NQ317_015263, partial [Molorchus minor]
MEKVHVIDILVVSELRHTLILGVDFWLAMGVVPDLKRDVWKFSSEIPINKVYGLTVDDNLTPTQRQRLHNLLEEKFE